jgi:MSHA biogenesis protein MshO
VVSTPVTYFCDTGAGQLTRYWDYTIQSSQPITPAALATGTSPKHAMLASNVQGCTFSYASLANTHSGLISLTLTLTSPNSHAGTIKLVQQVHVDNTP